MKKSLADVNSVQLKSTVAALAYSTVVISSTGVPVAAWS
eukprot:SAG31_NODE_599_length_13649_cov_9.930775_6_plen_39_part_00